jgi:hypothetical protein
MKMTIEEQAADLCGNRRFANRERKAIAQKIVDFMDIPAYRPRVRAWSPAERRLRKYQDQVQGLRAWTNAREVQWLVQSGQIASEW